MSYRELGRTPDRRKAMLRDITTDLIIDKRIATTRTRAKEVRSAVEKMTTLDERRDLHTHRQAATFIRNEVADVRGEDESIVAESALQGLFSDLGSRFVEHQGGCTRILKAEPRRGDAAPMVVIKFVE